MNFDEMRVRTLRALKGNMGNALLVALIVSLPGMIAQTVGTYLLSPITDIIYLLGRGGSITVDALRSTIDETMAQPGMVWMYVSAAVYLLVTPTLRVGQKRYTLMLLRNEQPGITAVFSRLSVFLKALLSTVLILFLAALPSLLASGLVILAVYAGLGDTAMTMLTYALEFLGIVFSLRILLKYTFTQHYMADHPRDSLFACMRWSRKASWRLLAPILSIYFTCFCLGMLAELIIELIALMFGSVIYSVLSMACQLAISVLLCTRLSAMYEVIKHPAFKVLVPHGKPITEDMDAPSENTDSPDNAAETPDSTKSEESSKPTDENEHEHH